MRRNRDHSEPNHMKSRDHTKPNAKLTKAMMKKHEEMINAGYLFFENTSMGLQAGCRNPQRCRDCEYSNGGELATSECLGTARRIFEYCKWKNIHPEWFI